MPAILACKDYAIDKPVRKNWMWLGRFGKKIMLPTNTLNSSVFFTCLYISKRHYKCDLNVANFIPVPSFVDGGAFISRILQKCVVIVDNLNVTDIFWIWHLRRLQVSLIYLFPILFLLAYKRMGDRF